MRLLLALLSILCFAAETTPRASVTFDRNVKPYLAANCISCHSQALNTADVNLEQYKSAADLAKDRETWEKVVDMLRTKQMPPKGAPQPSDAASKTVADWVEREFERIDAQAKPYAGSVTARRLNRTEYNNTVRDLLGVTLRPADEFPEDDSGYGFDNIGDVLSLSPVLMEKYLSAAEKVSRAALYGFEQMKPSGERFQPPGRRGVQPRSATDYDESGLSLGSALHVNYRFPVDGEYEFRATCDGRRQGSGGVDMAFWLDGKLLGVKHIDDNDLEGQTRQIRTPVTTGTHLVSVTFYKVFERLPASFGGLNPSEAPVSTRQFNQQPPPNATPEQLAAFQQRQRDRAAAGQAAVPPPANAAPRGLQMPAGKVDFLFIWGPFNQTAGPSPESLRKIFTCGHLDGAHQPACTRRIVSSLARRAFRRPVAAEEVDRLVNLVAKAQKRGNSFEESIAVGTQAILVSPHFLFRIERTPLTAAAANHSISQHELAARLSYFLWSSMPDAELSSLADRAALRNPVTLAAQVKRMLKDPKAQSLVENFSGQWLETRALESVKPDARRFAGFDDHLRLSMRRETELFFENVIREDRSVVDFLDGKYSFLNERLAEFYGIPGVKGQDFRRVDLAGTPRAGVLTHASVLTVSSYATRTSPVLRGKWVLENLLNTPPPPPPPNVPTLDDSKVGQAVSLRQQLEAHRTEAVCASCHSRMDPLGMALENFDAIGAWRDKDGAFPIDASGALPDGRSFNGPAELRTALAAQRQTFVDAVAYKLLTYAVGRGLEREDQRTVKEIGRRLAVKDYRFSSLVLEIVKSLPFQMRKGEQGKS